MQADVAPAGAPYPQYRAELILQAEWRENVTVTIAPPGMTVSGLHERAHAHRIPRQVGPLVDVVVQELILDEIRSGFLRQFFTVRAGEQQCGGVSGRPPECVDRHDLAKSWQDRGPQRVRIQPGPAGLGYRGGQVAERRTGEHGSLFPAAHSSWAATTS